MRMFPVGGYGMSNPLFYENGESDPARSLFYSLLRLILKEYIDVRFTEIQEAVEAKKREWCRRANDNPLPTENML